jgi:leucyl aminopeptidase (aminopeptidase T)
LMQCLTGAADIEGAAYETAQSMAAALQDAPSDTKAIPAVQELISTLSIFDSILKTVNYDEAASQIVTLLEERKEIQTGVCFTAASSSMHWPLLQTAKVILDKEEEEDSADSTKAIFTSAFDKRGVALLMERLTQIDTFRVETADSSSSSPAEKEVDDMRKALGHALARAFVAENAKKKLHRKSPRRKQDAVDRILSSDLWKHHLSVQEDVVRGMLEI